MHADLMLGADIARVLDAHITAGRGRVKGLRYSTVSHPDPAARGAMLNRPAGLMGEPAFRAGFAQLAPRNLSFDAWIYHTQIPELTDLARAFPETTIVLDHVGGVLAIGPYAGRREEVFADWKRDLAGLASCPNVRIKLGGLGMRLFGFDFAERPDPPTSADLATAWRPYVETAITLFGADRAMFESNFPVDKLAYAYAIGWNAFKRITSGASSDERAALFHDTAQATYRL
jgi:predicted TIM-barrel fold metal-dependent hydrolase